MGGPGTPRTATEKNMTIRQFLSAHGITPKSPAVDVIDAYMDWIGERRPDLAHEDKEDRADAFLDRYLD